MNKYAMLMTTAASSEDAKAIGNALLDQRLAACIQLIPITSMYTWKGERSEDAEVLLLVKTRQDLAERVIVAIRESHKYEVPEILQVPIEGGLDAYLHWVDEVTG